ncbi:hypothetical protein ABLG96_12010 [Nakamurella sp. A5-74]|uniref:Uncharacterized protein n=1 Tax=Nakamurella sp. A5-74 TaxID=3158264 RepID=A0AAU8DIK0_9ACTN
MTSAGDGGTRPLPSVGGPGVGGPGVGGPSAAPHDHRARRSPQDEQPTTVIGRVPERHAVNPQPRAPERAGRGLRGIEMISGLLGGGLLLAGLVLLVLQFVAPALVTAGRGPGWSAVAVHLGVGAVAELLRAVRGRLGPPARWAAATLVIAAAIGVLFLVWW